MASRHRSHRILDCRCPENWQHPLNRGLVFETAINAPLPGWVGSSTVRDMVRGAKTPHDGTLVGTPKWSGSSFGTSISLNGSTQCIAVPDDSSDAPAFLSVPNGSNLTVGVLLKFNDVTTVSVPFANRNSGGTAQSLYGIILSSGSLLAYYRDDATGGVNGVTVASPSTGVWYHVVLVMDGTASGKRLQVYINGVQVYDSGTFGAIGPVATLSPRFRIGCQYNGGNAQFCNEVVAGITAHNRLLSSTEVAALYNQTRCGNPDRWNWLRQVTYFVPNITPPPAVTDLAWLQSPQVFDRTVEEIYITN